MTQKHAKHGFRQKRRLSFERCEPRLTLSGDGGFVLFDLSDYLSPGGNDFVLVSNSDQVVHTNNLGIPRSTLMLSSSNAALDVATSFDGGSRPYSANPPLDVIQLPTSSQVGDAYLGDNGQKDQQTWGDIKPGDRDVRDVINEYLSTDSALAAEGPESSYKPADLVPSVGDTVSKSASLVGSAGEELVTIEGELAHSAIAPSRAEMTETPALLPITAQDALRLGKQSVELELAHYGAESEGGAIEVSLAVAQTQRAYEAEVFAEVAAQLEGKVALAENALPKAEPLIGELARAVVFEMAGQDSTDEEALPRSAVHDPSAALPADQNAVAAAVIKDEREQDEASRSWAFAQWPLFFSATLGLALVGNRRWRQPEAALQPPRRGRQTPSS
jgi:hypothetical protein